MAFGIGGISKCGKAYCRGCNTELLSPPLLTIVCPMQDKCRELRTILGIFFCAMVMLSSPAISATRGEAESLTYYQDALKRLEEGNAAAAIVQLRNAIQSDPGNLDARLLLGRLYLQAGDAPSAAKELRH